MLIYLPDMVMYGIHVNDEHCIINQSVYKLCRFFKMSMWVIIIRSTITN